VAGVLRQRVEVGLRANLLGEDTGVCLRTITFSNCGDPDGVEELARCPVTNSNNRKRASKSVFMYSRKSTCQGNYHDGLIFYHGEGSQSRLHW